MNDQRSLTDQLQEVYMFAVQCGLYDAATWMADQWNISKAEARVAARASNAEQSPSPHKEKESCDSEWRT